MLDSPRARQQSRNADAYSGELAGKPLDRALLACLIEQAGPGAPIADVGCGRSAGSLRGRD